MVSLKTPWSWKPPPLPPGLFLLNPTDKSVSEIWHRSFWGVEALSAWYSQSLPGITDLILSCRLSFDQIEPMTVTTRRPLDHRIVRSVVRALRFDHPTIASRYAWPDKGSGKYIDPGEGRFAYEIPSSEQDIDRWLSEVVLDRNDVLLAANYSLDDAVNLVRRELGTAASRPRTTAFELHHIAPHSGSHAIVLRLGHILFDAISTFQLMDLFNAKLAQFLSLESDPSPQLAWGKEVSRLSGPFPERSKVPWSPNKIEQDNFMIEKLHDAMLLGLKAHGLPIPNPTAPASTTGMFFRTVSPETLSKLVAVTRNNGCTLFSVLFAIEMITLLRVNPPAHEGEITTPFYPSAFNLRAKYLANEQQDRTNWELSSALAFNVIIARDLGRFIRRHENPRLEQHDHSATGLVSDVLLLAKEIHAQLEEQRQYMDRAGFWVHEMIDTIINAAKPSPVPVPTLSSLGVVDAHLSTSHTIRVSATSKLKGDAQMIVSHPIFAICSPYAPHDFPLVVHPYTWCGTLYITFSFPEANMGLVEELIAARGSGGDAGRTGGDIPTVLDTIEEFMRILGSVAGSGR